MLSDRCLSCLSVCNVGVLWQKTFGWINVPLGTEVGLGPGDIVSDPAPPWKGNTAAPIFRPMSIAAKRSLISTTAELLLMYA